ncbi:PAS domain-containing protein [Streptomyces caniscabiei]|uniref:PAS domain-containing protein n=1 Tax=Streptomyces caniscabiei TaxID=2746961 RepID=A0A927QD21_9ACTN|nr:PAS domain-containing protein [Streptomyces caniscabiei]MBD9721871.1 PAS domain-containing protein [Streptomyces caniscabiei]MDX3509062.1 PAS domain-containing protein [Streptomyces caniscabiei]MDX3717185.1 PAS domain-containing protein [Streptomyces caniscabiei]MDX3728204.1 PAS domain-containing protein [Streptomyces caniscabiei]WEO23049.1 PAS domain-containing protein [Streptomyces caniscabiei]
MAQTDEFGEEIADFVRRVAELKAARSVPTEDLPTVLDAAFFELDHVAAQLRPWYERLTASGPVGGAVSAAQEHQLLRNVFQSLPLPVVLVDRETVVRRLNRAATAFTGVRSGYATGRPLSGFLAHADRGAFRSQAAAVARGEGDRSLDVHLQQRPSLPVRATLTQLPPGSGEPRHTVLVVLQPAGHRMPPVEPSRPLPDLTETTRHAALMDLLDAMTTALLTAPPEAALDRAARVLHGRFADWVVADTTTPALTRSTVLAPSEEEAKLLMSQDPATCPLVVTATRGGSPALQIRPADPAAFGHDGSGAPVLVKADVTSLLAVPLAPPDGPVRGVLTLFRSGARLAFSMAEARAMDTMSRHMALAMETRAP